MALLDGWLEDRQLPFLDKLAAAQGVLQTSPSIADHEKVLNWTLSTLLKLSKVQDPRVDIFSNKLLWEFLSLLFCTCFDRAVKYTNISSNSTKIRCKQPVLPAFVTYLRLFRQCSEEFLSALRYATELYAKNYMDLNGQINNYIELCQVAKEHLCCHDSCLCILLTFFDKFNSKKTLFPFLVATASLLSTYNQSNDVTDGLLGIVLNEIGADGVVDDSILQIVSSLSDCLQARFFELFLLRFKTEASEGYRMIGFAFFKQLMLLRPSNAHVLFDLLDKKHVYVRRNDSLYNEQLEFFKNLIPDASSMMLSALLSLDYYLIVDEFEVVKSLEVMHCPLLQSTLFEMAVRSREVDKVIKMLRKKQVKPNQGILFTALMNLDLHMLRHYETEINDCTDGYWEVLVHLCQYPDIQERINACCLDIKSKNTLLRYNNCEVDDDDDEKKVEMDVRFVPVMNSEQFAQFLAEAPLSSVMKMLEVAAFYEFGQLQEPFEEWLLEQDVHVQSECIQLIPCEYLTNRTCKQLLTIKGIGRIAKRRSKVLQYAIDHDLLNDPQILHACCMLAVRKHDNPANILKLLQSHPNKVLQVRPINPQQLCNVMSFFEPKASFVPYAMLCENKDELLERIRDNDPESVIVQYPHLYSVPLKQVREDCIANVIMEYPEEEQVAFLQEAVAVNSVLINRMLSDKRSRSSILRYLTGLSMVDVCTAKLLTGMTKIEGDKVLPLILCSLKHALDVDGAVQCMSLLARHRSEAIMSPKFITVYFDLLVNFIPQLKDPLTCHDYNRIVFDLSQHVKTRTSREAVFCLLVKYVQIMLPVHLKTILDRGMHALLGFVEDSERALLWCPDDLSKSRLRDLLLSL